MPFRWHFGHVFFCVETSGNKFRGVCSLSRVRLFATAWTIVRRALLCMGFSRREYWSGVHALWQGIFPTQGSTRVSGLLHWQTGSLPSEPPGKPRGHAYIPAHMYSVWLFMSHTHKILTTTPVRNVLGVFPIYLSEPQCLQWCERPVHAGPSHRVPIHPSTHAGIHLSIGNTQKTRPVRLLLRHKVLEHHESWSVPPDVSHSEGLWPQRGLWEGHPNSKLWHLPQGTLSSAALTPDSTHLGQQACLTFQRPSVCPLPQTPNCSRSDGKTFCSEISLSQFSFRFVPVA